MRKILDVLALLIILSSCSKNTPSNPYKGQNNVFLTLSDERESLRIDNTYKQTVDFLVRLTSPATEDITIDVTVSGEGSKDFKLNTPVQVKIAKGTFEGRFSLTPDIRLLVAGERIAEVTLKTSATSVIVPTRGFKITIATALPIELTDRERSLLQSYKKRWGIDVLPLLGNIQCDGRIEWAGFKDMDLSYPKLVEARTVLVEKQVMIVGLSAHATEDRIILEFKHNALGQAAFMRELWEHLTILDRSYWNNPNVEIRPPYSTEIMKRIAWSPEKTSEETFDVQLDNVRLNPETGEITFVGAIKESVRYGKDYAYYEDMDDKLIVVPLHFETSVWRRMIEEYKKDATFRGVVYGGNVNLYSILNHESVMKDTSEVDNSKFFVPEGKIDFTTNTMSFKYPFYVENSDRYSNTFITCKPLAE